MAASSNGREAIDALALRRAWSTRSNSVISVIGQLRAKARQQAGKSGASTRGGAPGRSTELRGIKTGHVTKGQQGPVVRVKARECVGEVKIPNLTRRIERLTMALHRQLDDGSATAPTDELPRLVRRNRDQPGPQSIDVDAGQAAWTASSALSRLPQIKKQTRVMSS